jgi:4-alpha-glucanotransferase
MSFNRPTRLWAFPIEAVSQSEAGFEAVHQSVCVMPHWIVQGDVAGRWSVNIEVTLAAEHEVIPRSRNGKLAISGIS